MYRDQWDAAATEELETARMMLARDSTTNWPRGNHDLLAQARFERWFGVRCASPRSELLQDLLEACISYVSRVAAAGTELSGWFESSAPWGQANLGRVGMYARCVSNRETTIDRAALLETATEAEAWFLQDLHEEGDGGMWRSEHAFHAAIRLALIGGDRDYAGRILAKGIPGVGEDLDQRRFLRRIIEADRYPITDPDLLRKLRTFFDEFRRPAPLDQRVARFEVALIWDLYVTSPDQALDWERAIDTFTE